jgi:hypothetical protein
VGPANETIANTQTFKQLSSRNETSSINYTLTQEVTEGMKVINLEFKEPVTGFIAYTLKTSGEQSLHFLNPIPNSFAWYFQKDKLLATGYSG